MQDTDLAAGYSESLSPSQSAKGSFTNLGAETTQGSRGNKENAGGVRRSRAGFESKYLDKQNHMLLGKAAACYPPLATLMHVAWVLTTSSLAYSLVGVAPRYYNYATLVFTFCAAVLW